MSLIGGEGARTQDLRLRFAFKLVSLQRQKQLDPRNNLGFSCLHWAIGFRKLCIRAVFCPNEFLIFAFSLVGLDIGK